MKRRSKISLKACLLLSAFLLETVCATAAGRIIYVDDDAPPGGDGVRWSTAYNHLQDALADANSGPRPVEIFVAQGVYEPDKGATVTPGDRDAAFRLINGVTIKGGYAGFGELDPNERDIESHGTVLSGDLNANDQSGVALSNLRNDPCRADNSYHLISSRGTDASAVVDGVTITGGNANGPWQECLNCGGGMYNCQGSPTLTNCTFCGNAATYGGAMHNDSSSPTVTKCTFTRNTALYGGGIENYPSSSPTLENCVFSENLATEYGGAINNGDSSNPSLTNCTFIGNSSYEGGALYNYESSPILANCTFTGNTASDGGAVYNDYSSPVVRDCTLRWNLVAGNAGGIYNLADSNPRLTRCTFIGNAANYGGAVYNDSSAPLLTGCVFTENSAHADGGAIYNEWDSNLIATYCTLIANFAVNQGGAVWNSNANPLFTNCVFLANLSYEGGGVFSSVGEPTLTNCLFSGNSCYYQGAGLFNEGSPTLANCTFSGNFAEYLYGGGMVNAGAARLANCIFWDNVANGQISESAQIHALGGTLVIDYCCVQGWTGALGGTGNIGSDPLFIDANGPDNIIGTEDDNVRLLSGSPCIDAGNSTAVPPDRTDLDGDSNTTEPTPWDLDGYPRFVNDPTTTDQGIGSRPIVDMGAHEFVLPGDFDFDGDVDLADFGFLADYWQQSSCGACGGTDLTGDGQVSLHDLEEFVANWLASE